MKTFNFILKLLAVLAAIAGAVYVIATYGDKIVAWTRALLNKFNNCCCCCCCETADAEAVAEETPAEETAVQAEENDFEG